MYWSADVPDVTPRRTTQLKTALLGLNERTRAVLEFFFVSTGKSAFIESSEDCADVAIFDYDNPVSRDHWDRFHTVYSKPGLLLSISEQVVSDAFWIQKPISPDALLTAASNIHHHYGRIDNDHYKRADEPVAAIDLQPAFETVPGASVNDEHGTTAPESLDETERSDTVRAVLQETLPPEQERFCGVRNDIDPDRIIETRDLFYNPTHYLADKLRESYYIAMKWQVPTRLDLDGQQIILVPSHDCAYISFSPDSLADLCSQPVARRYKSATIGIDEFSAMRPTLGNFAIIHGIENMLWISALDAAQGRLPIGTDPKRMVFLEHWPNITRLHQVPHALRISALWGTRGASLVETSRILNISQRHVFAFYSAAMTLGLITFDGSRIERMQKKVHRQRGLLSRFLKWLRTK